LISEKVGEVQKETALIRKDIELMSERVTIISTTVTVRVGTAMAGLIGLLFAALKLT
jgi:hypothetical protein